jgi:carbon storage regulator
MLVLSRRPGQKIVIGNEITIEVVSVSGEGVRLGISAPESVSVHRYEVFEEIQKANEAASVNETEVDQASLENLSAHLRGKQK